MLFHSQTGHYKDFDKIHELYLQMNQWRFRFSDHKGPATAHFLKFTFMHTSLLKTLIALEKEKGGGTWYEMKVQIYNDSF